MTTGCTCNIFECFIKVMRDVLPPTVARGITLWEYGDSQKLTRPMLLRINPSFGPLHSCGQTGYDELSRAQCSIIYRETLCTVFPSISSNTLTESSQPNSERTHSASQDTVHKKLAPYLWCLCTPNTLLQ